MDVYDAATGNWSYSDGLSADRRFVATVAVGDKVYFASGESISLGSQYPMMDVLDTTTGQWSVAPLPAPIYDEADAVAVGHLAVFRGAGTLEVYDTIQGAWSTLPLSDGRGSASITVLDDSVYVGGGYVDGAYSNKVDIFTFSFADPVPTPTAVLAGTILIVAGSWRSER